MSKKERNCGVLSEVNEKIKELSDEDFEKTLEALKSLRETNKTL